jgi:CheY-like chemotaxis protein
VNNFSILNGLQILVVDDNVDTLELITILLEEYEAHVTTAASVGEALEVMAQFRPDILISDIAMPNEDGYSLIHKVRNLEAERGGFTPAIALTAYAGDVERSLALDAGFQMHVSKPVDPIELVAVVAKLIQAQH